MTSSRHHVQRRKTAQRVHYPPEFVTEIFCELRRARDSGQPYIHPPRVQTVHFLLEVVAEIFSHLVIEPSVTNTFSDPPRQCALVSCALVCREWLEPARRALYRRPFVAIGGTEEPYNRAPKLLVSLREDHLNRYVRGLLVKANFRKEMVLWDPFKTYVREAFELCERMTEVSLVGFTLRQTRFLEVPSRVTFLSFSRQDKIPSSSKKCEFRFFLDLLKTLPNLRQIHLDQVDMLAVELYDVRETVIDPANFQLDYHLSGLRIGKSWIDGAALQILQGKEGDSLRVHVDNRRLSSDTPEGRARRHFAESWVGVRV